MAGEVAQGAVEKTKNAASGAKSFLTKAFIGTAIVGTLGLGASAALAANPAANILTGGWAALKAVGVKAVAGLPDAMTIASNTLGDFGELIKAAADKGVDFAADMPTP